MSKISQAAAMATLLASIGTYRYYIEHTNPLKIARRKINSISIEKGHAWVMLESIDQMRDDACFEYPEDLVESFLYTLLTGLCWEDREAIRNRIEGICALTRENDGE